MIITLIRQNVLVFKNNNLNKFFFLVKFENIISNTYETQNVLYLKKCNNKQLIFTCNTESSNTCES